LDARLSDRIAGAILLAAAAWYGWAASSYQQSFSDPVGPSLFPQLVAVPLGLLALALIVRPDPDPAWLHGSHTLRQGATLLILVAYPALLEPLGFPLSTFLGTLLLARVLGATWLQSTLTGLAVGVGLFLTFDTLLGLPLPLEPGLGG
jgi:putative tricarboxylic transport membrane protein